MIFLSKRILLVDVQATVNETHLLTPAQTGLTSSLSAHECPRLAMRSIERTASPVWETGPISRLPTSTSCPAESRSTPAAALEIQFREYLAYEHILLLVSS